MAVSSNWVQDEELGMGTKQQNWEEEEDEEGKDEQEFERYLDENGVLVMEDQAVQGVAHNGAFATDDDNILGLEEDGSLGLDEQGIFTLDENGIMVFKEQDAYYPQSSPSLSGAFSFEEQKPQSKAMDQISFEWSDRRDSNSLPTSSSMGERSTGHNVNDSIEDLQPENLNGLEAPQIWMPIRDRQLDMTEDEQDKASSVELERPEANFGPEGSEEEEFPDLPFDGQYQSDNDLSVEVMLDSNGIYEEYQKVLDSVQMTENDWEHSDGSPDPPRGPVEYPYQSDDGSENSGQEAAYSISQLGETLGFPSELPEYFSEVQMGAAEPSPLTDSSHWKMSQSLLSHVSMEDLQNGPVIDDETFPESSYTESIDDSTALGFTMSNIGRISSQGPFASVKKSLNRQGDHMQKVQIPNNMQQSSSKLSRRAQTLKMPALLPSKASRPSRSLSPHRNPVDKKTARSRSPRPSPTAELSYGRGQLNYPLPDFSKVEPRVKFDQSYRPPKTRNLLRRPGEAEAPLVFKSPAEIVREVLLSSTEGSPQKTAYTNATVPEDFRSPRQATDLVNQLQEDYNRLLTKYAEAENTIDRLRLETKVNLYSDPPKPSHSLPMGTVTQGSKVMTFTIPQAHVAQYGQIPSQSQDHGAIPIAIATGDDIAEEQESSGSHSTTGGHRTSAKHSNISGHSAAGEHGTTEADGGHATNEPSPGEYLTQTLAKQAEKFQRQVESFESLIQMGKLSPQEQLKGLQRLKGAQDALEKAYLQAREEHRLLKQRRGQGGSHGEFDPERAVEGEIFRLGMQVEELKDGIDQTMQSHPAPSIHPEPIPVAPFSDHITQPPSPSAITPMPAVRTPYPEDSIPKESVKRAQVEVSSASSESEDGDAIPEPLRHKQAEVEKNFDHLLGQYNSFKTLPDAMGLETGFTEEGSPGEVGNAPKDARRSRRTWRRPSLREEKSQTAPQPQPMEVKPSLPEKAFEITFRHSQAPSIRGNESQPKSPAVKPSTPTTKTKSSLSSHQSPTGSPISESPHLHGNLPQKRYLQPKVLHSQDRIVSPETDSGFIGSDGSRISPQTPEQNPPHSRSFQEHNWSPSLSPPNARTLAKPSSSHTRIIRMPDRMAKKPASTSLRSSLKKDGQPASSNKVPHVTLASVSDLPPRRHYPRQSGSQGGMPRGSRIPPSSPPRWSNSVTDTENEQDADIAPIYSEIEEHSDAGTFQTNRTSMRSPSIPATPSLSPLGTRTKPDPLGSRLARNEAIHALQDEVLRLRQRIEQTMQRPQRSSKETIWNRSQPPDDSPRPHTSKLFGRISTEGTQEDFEEPSQRLKPSVRIRSASMPHEELEQEIGLDTDRSLQRPHSQKSQPGWATGHSSQRQAGASSFTGPYTGAEYHLTSPRPLTPEATLITDSFCPQCQGTRESSPDSVPVSGIKQQVMHSTPKKVMHSIPQTTCPLCSGNKNNTSPHVKPVSVIDEGTGATSSQSSEATAKAAKKKQEHQPGVWVMAGPPSPSPIASYIPAVPYVPYSPSLVFCASPASTSTFPGSSRLYYPNGYRVTELQVPEVRQQRRGHRRSMTLGIEDLEDLRWSLSRAVEAAQSMKLTTKKMSRSLTCDLSNVKTLRESCLF